MKIDCRCRYKCTWKTVKYFNDILHLSVPQFYGKWPFLAIWIPFIMPIPIQVSFSWLYQEYSSFLLFFPSFILFPFQYLFSVYFIHYLQSTVPSFSQTTMYFQEFASVVFSILNLFTTFSMYRTVKRLRSSNRLKIVWTAYSVIGIIMW